MGLRIYSEFFEKDPAVPIVATQDIDFLLTNPPRISKKVDVSEILSSYGLIEEYSPTGDYSKFIGPDFEVEFLYPEKGRGEPSGKKIKELGITATPLRYLHFIESNTRVMDYKSMPVKVPEPAAFVLMKYLLINKRKEKAKVAKDISTALDLEFFLLENGYKEGFKTHFRSMPKKWRKELMAVLENNNSELFSILKEE